MRLKTKKLRASVARKIVASLVAGGLICTGSFAFAEDTSNQTREVEDTDANDNQLDAAFTNSSTGSTNNNKMTVRNVKNISFLHGGYAQSSNSGTGKANNNTVYIWDSKIYHIHGGHIGYGAANYNKVFFHSGEVSALTGAGYADSGEASFNELYIYGGKLNGTTQGGYVINDGKANGNAVNIYGGEINGDIYGGYVGGTGEVSGNTIRIYGGNLSGANIYAGYLGGNTNLYGSGNALEFYTKGITAQQIGGFDTLRFYLPNNIASGDTILTLTGSQTDLSQTAIHMVNSRSNNLKFGDSIDLISNGTGVSFDKGQLTEINSRNPYGSPVIADGISWVNRVGFEEIKDSANNTVALRANIGERILNPDVKIINQGVTEAHSALDRGTDRILNWLPPEELEMKKINETTQFEMFMGMGGGVTSIDTGNGTKLKNKDGGTNIGFARVLKNRHGFFIFAPITDYGTATYNSNVTDGFGTRGGGHSQHFTAGLIARQWNKKSDNDPGGMYYEASFRVGRMKTGFNSDNFWTGSQQQHISYSEETPVYTGHVRIGWRSKVSPQNIMDIYGIYTQNHVGAIDATISPTDQNYRIESSDSKRFRIGARLTRLINDHNRFYSGLAYQYENGGRGLSKYMDTETLNGGLKGSSGMIELGWQLQPTPNSAVMLDSALVGWIGKQKGLSFQIKMKKEF